MRPVGNVLSHGTSVSCVSGKFSYFIIDMKKLLNSDWQREMQFSGNIGQKRVQKDVILKPSTLIGQLANKLSHGQSNESLGWRNLCVIA